MKLRTFKVEGGFFDAALPAGAWDKKWAQPQTAARAALDRYAAVRHEVRADLGDDLLSPDALATTKLTKSKTEQRRFALLPPEKLAVGGEFFRGGGFGEIFRQVSFGVEKIHFHAQNVVFGVDASGLYFVEATVGRLHGGWGCRAALSVRFARGPEVLGGVLWQGELDPPQDKPVRFVGRSARLAVAFGDLTEIEVAFFSQKDARRG